MAIIEAMKMENEITAHKSGTVSALPIAVGASVAAGDVLAVIESQRAAAGAPPSGWRARPRPRRSHDCSSRSATGWAAGPGEAQILASVVR